MRVSDLISLTPFASCVQIAIEDDLLEALVVNKRRITKYSHINPIVYGGHGRDCAARQVLSFLFRRALGIARVPGTYDIALQSQHFTSYTTAELDGACRDITRIYEHSQKEMLRHAAMIKLVRGISGIEASVCAKLLSEITESEIPFYFQTVTFFNHIQSAFSRQVEVVIDCPVSWIWASAYTLKDLELPGSDEEFMVVCRSDDGTLKVPTSNFQITQRIHPIERIESQPYRSPRHIRDCLPIALSALMLEGFEPDNYERHIAYYQSGRWEQFFMSLGRRLDSLLDPLFRNAVYFSSRKMH